MITKYNRVSNKTANFFKMPRLSPVQTDRAMSALNKYGVGAGAVAGTLAGGIGGAMSAGEDASWTDRLGRAALGAGVGAGVGAGAGYGLRKGVRAGLTNLNQNQAVAASNAMAEQMPVSRFDPTQPAAAGRVDPDSLRNQKAQRIRELRAMGAYDNETIRNIARQEYGFKKNVAAVASFYANPANYAYF